MRGTKRLVVLLLAAAFLFTASAGTLSLKGFDDCRYARKGLEMLERGAFFETTWAGQPDPSYPPLQFWIVGRSFAIFGANDFAARLPSILMALGICVLTYLIGKRTVGSRAAVAGIAVLLITPVFVTHARRAMIDVPLCFWTTLAFLVFLLGLRRPRLHLLFAIPLGAAILTKSVLGLLPLVVVPAAALSPALRRSLRNPWLWGGVLAGLAVGAAWPAHQYARHGGSFLRAHFDATIFSRVAGASEFDGPSESYVTMLLEEYQPVVLVAFAGLVLFLWNRRRRESGRSDLLVWWVLIPLVLYSLSVRRSAKYLIPLVPAFSLFAGHLLQEKARPVARALSKWVAPVLVVAAGAVYWIAPTLLTGDGNAVYKEYAPTARAELPAGSVLPYVGAPRDEYRNIEHVALWYWNVDVEQPSPPREAVAAALAAEHRSLVCQRDRLAAIDSLGVAYELAVMRGWGLVRLSTAP